MLRMMLVTVPEIVLEWFFSNFTKPMKQVRNVSTVDICFITQIEYVI